MWWEAKKVKPKIKNQSKNKNASKMGCKVPFDARFEAYESSRRALSDYAIKNFLKRNFWTMPCSVFLPQIWKTNEKFEKSKEKAFDQIFKELKISPTLFQTSKILKNQGYEKEILKEHNLSKMGCTIFLPRNKVKKHNFKKSIKTYDNK